MSESNVVQPGRYRHYKGGEYEVMGVAIHSETDELMVVYRCLYGDRGLWEARSASTATGVSDGGTMHGGGADSPVCLSWKS